MRKQLMEIFDLLYDLFGPQHWWPGNGSFEVIVGAILAQNTAWKNVEKALGNLKRVGVLSPEALASLDSKALAELIRPSGTYRVKADRLLRFLHFLREEYGLSPEAMLGQPLVRIRPQLLEIRGIGPETADSILLYAGGHRTFVVDAYTKRIFSRHGFIPPECSYEEVRSLFMQVLPQDARLYNEYHALIVQLGKSHCLIRPRCQGCVLEPLLEHRENPSSPGQSGRPTLEGKPHLLPAPGNAWNQRRPRRGSRCARSR